MSRTYDIACHDCKVKLWIGQGSGENAYLYTTIEHRKALRDFLFSHHRHRLEFGDDESMWLDDYQSLDDDSDNEGVEMKDTRLTAEDAEHQMPVPLIDELRIEAALVPNRRGELYALAADEIEHLRASLVAIKAMR